MEYRSPLGSTFKLGESILALKEEKNKETPKKDDVQPVDSGDNIRKSNNFDNRRSSRGNRNSQFGSPIWQRQSNNWKSPNPRNSHHGNDSSIPISQFYHPSMLENPWEELEKNLK